MQKNKLIILLGIIILLLTIVFLGKIIEGFFFVYNVASNSPIQLSREKKGSVNILLLGKGGKNHEGPNLTDTIIFANIKTNEKIINLVSIPRDLWIPALNAKVNAAYEQGEEKGNRGMFLAKKTTESIIGQKVDYVVIVDFSGFVRLVDLLGGIDVDVQRSFEDYQYPIEGKENDTCGRGEEELTLLATAESQLEAFPCRYKHIKFEKGTQHMDGQKALEFTRSRHANGAEGTDFARSERQQQIISSIKKKVFSLGTILNPVKVIGIFDILKNNIATDISPQEFDDFINLARRMEVAQIKSTVVDSGDLEQKRYGLLINPPISQTYNYAWVLIPRIGNGDFSEINDYIACVISENICLVDKEGILQKEANIN